MIYYFSGTGNSRLVAEKLALLLGEPTPTLINYKTARSLSPLPHQRIGFVLPVYAWGLPQAVVSFLTSIASNASSQQPYVYALLTHGDDMGYTDKQLDKLLASKRYELQASFSLQMRNTYVSLPGFTIDQPDVAQRKQQTALARLDSIAQRIQRGDRSQESDLTRGTWPWVKSYLLRPLFNRFLIQEHRFHVDKDRCIGCGKCETICPLHNIQLNADKHPTWQGHCTHCLGCFHVCPVHAINYGKMTQYKQQVKCYP